jgi:hypothetical protein
VSWTALRDTRGSEEGTERKPEGTESEVHKGEKDGMKEKGKEDRKIIKIRTKQNCRKGTKGGGVERKSLRRRMKKE